MGDEHADINVITIKSITLLWCVRVNVSKHVYFTSTSPFFSKWIKIQVRKNE